MRKSLWWCLALMICTSGCGDDILVIEPEPQRPLQPHRTPLLDLNVSVAIPLGEGKVLVDTEEGLRLLRSPEDPGVIVADAGELGEFRSVYVGSESVLIAGTLGVFALHGTTFFTSPVGESLADGEVVQQFLTAPDDNGVEVIWMLTDRALYRVEGGEALRVNVAGVEWSDAVMGRAPGVRGTVIWVATGTRLIEVGVSRGVTHAGEVQTGIEVSSMATDGAGQLWLVGGGELYRLRSDRRLDRYRLPVVVERLLASGVGPDLWLLGEGALWHFGEGKFRFVELEASSGTFAAEADGRLLHATSSGVIRYRARHPLDVLGVTDGARITGPIEVLIMPHPSERPRIDAYIDGFSIMTFDEPFRIMLDPVRLDIGVHRLRVEAHYQDGTLPAFREFSLQVGVDVTWMENIAPLFERECARCHGTIEDASTRLDSRQAWIDNIDSILYNVRQGRMPLGETPLSPGDVDLISAWRAAGFPE